MAFGLQRREARRKWPPRRSQGWSSAFAMGRFPGARMIRHSPWPVPRSRCWPKGVADGNEPGVVRLRGSHSDEPVLEWNAHRGAVARIGHIGGAMAGAGAAGTLYVVDASTREVVGAMFVNGGIAAVRVVSAPDLAVLRRDGYLVHYRLEFAS